MTSYEELNVESKRMSAAVYREEFTIPSKAIDQNGHVNNVVYVQWMQDLALRHFESLGGDQAVGVLDGMWVVRSHHIKYLRPAHAGERVRGETWIVRSGRVRLDRRYQFVRLPDEILLTQGDTEWVFVNTKTGRPQTIPKAVRQVFQLDSYKDEEHPKTKT
jgi:acyl-CoA thioester hydrolase